MMGIRSKEPGAAMKTFALGYLVSGVLFLAIDAVWLGIMGNALYRPQLGSLMLEKIQLAPAVAFYLIYPAGIAVFAVAPALQAGAATEALGYGLLLGLVAYATYNLTNLATLRGWSPLVTIADTAWGGTATALAAVLAFTILRWLGKA
jgi:uncharacterized membrane protein